MHRKVKGLLSAILAFAMVTVTVAPVSADELSGEQQPAETQSVMEITEIEEEPVEQDSVQEPAAEEEIVEQDVVQEPEEEIEPVEQDTAQAPVAEGEQLTAADIVSVVEELMLESDMTPAEQAAAEIALASVSDDGMFDYLYGKLTADQKKFRVFAGTNIGSESTFLDDGVVPDNMTSQSTAIGNLRNSRTGDLQFYTSSGWKLWKVDSYGAPDIILKETDVATLNKIATEDNFKQAVYIENNGTGTDPEVLCQQPILEAIWKCISYPIPVYDTDGNDTGEKVEITAENYSTASFPNMEGVYWKLIYKDTECRLNTASEIWTNDTNGIRKIGITFDENEAKLQAYIDDSVPEGPQYVVTGQEGKNGWYTSDVTISAKEGYEVRLSETDEWASSVLVTESGAVTLYVKAASGAEQPAQTLRYFIDKTAPVISGVENGQTYYSNEIQVMVTDEHLETVMKNNGDVGVNDNKAYIALNPSEDLYTIFAEDAAGNQTICNVSVKQAESQLQDGTAEFTQPGWRVGEEKPAPIVSSITNGVENITYYYKVQGAEDSTYTTTVPSEAGKYTAMAVFAATEAYNVVVITSDFEISPSVLVEVDGTAPVISGVENGKTYYGDQKVTVTDENLSLVTVNGSAVAVSGNSVDITLKPSDEKYSIVAKDTAGNQTQYTVEVLETWVRDGITTNGKKNLKKARMYKLGSGQWTVDGDSTVYSGGGTFYVKNGGEYDFKKK